MVARMRINGDPAIMLALFSSVFRQLKCSNYAGHNRRKPSAVPSTLHDPISVGVNNVMVQNNDLTLTECKLNLLICEPSPLEMLVQRRGGQCMLKLHLDQWNARIILSVYITCI